MSDTPEQHRDHKPPYIDDSLVINTRLSEIERQQAEEKQYQREYNRKQLSFNFWLALFTALLFVTSVVSDVLLFRYVQLTMQSADAATSAAKTASATLEEIRKGGSDTHALAVSAGKQADAARALASVTKEQNTVLRDQVRSIQEGQTLHERPWLKISHRIVSPLTFDVGGRSSGIPVALMMLEDTIENVGQSVAVEVFSWEDIIPLDPDHSPTTARARQKERCDADRHPDRRYLSGYAVFPHDPMVQQSTVGPQMPTVTKAVIQNEPGLTGKVGLALVGCVCYRSSFEPKSNPTHQTRFIYFLGIPTKEGAFNPYVLPQGTASALRLIRMPIGFTAD